MNAENLKSKICIFLLFSCLKFVLPIIYVDHSSNNGNGSILSPYSEIEVALNENLSIKDDFFLFASEFTYNITSVKVFVEPIIISGVDSDSVSLAINERIIIKNRLELNNLSIKSSFDNFAHENYVILVDDNANFIINNCSFKNLASFTHLKYFILLMNKGTFLLNFSKFMDISIDKIEILIKGYTQSQIIITNSSFTNIELRDSEMFSLNFATIHIINSTFFYIWCRKLQVRDLAFLDLYNSDFLMKNSKFLSLKFLYFSFIQITQNNENYYTEKDVFKNSFSDILFLEIYSMIEKDLAFIKITSELCEHSFKMEGVKFINVTVIGSVIQVDNQNKSILKEIQFILSNSERHISIKDNEYFEIHDSFFYFSNLLLDNEKQKDANIYFDNVKNKKIENISIENSFSQTTAAIILQSNDALASYSTKINNSYFFNNTASYIDNIEIGVVIFAVGNEKIDILNSKFFKNSLVTLQNFYQFGGSCLKCQGRNFNLTIIDSLFFENQAIFDSNCIQFEGNMLFINRSFFNLNTNFIVPTYKTIIETLGYGGCISMTGLNLSVIDCFFSENMNYFGGTIYFDGNSDSKTIIIFINKSIFIDNYSHTFGACLYINKVLRMNAYISNLILFYNWANYNGAFYFTYDSKDDFVYIENVFFILGWSDFGPGIHFDVDAGYFSLKNCSFLNNTASWYPRNLSKYGYNKIPLDNGGCGAIAINSHPDKNFSLISQDNLYADNLARGLGGALGMNSGSFSDNNSKFIRNSANHEAIIYSHIRSFITINNSLFIDNVSFKKISGISSREFSFLLINNSYFLNNICSSGEGLLYFYTQSEAYVYNSYFENISSLRGGILNVRLNRKGFLVLENNIFNESYFENTYELFYMSDSDNIFVIKNLFINLKKNIFTVVNSNIFLLDNQVKNIDCSFSLKDGCFIEIKKNSQLIINNLKIENLTISQSKAILIQDSISAFFRCHINNLKNKVVLIKIENSLNNFSEVAITNFFSGAIELINSNLSIQNSFFSKELTHINKKYSDIEISVIQSTNAPYLEFYNVTFENNYWTTNGSALNLICFGSFENKIYILKNCLFKNNLANGNGGAIYIEECNVEIQMTFFFNNLAALCGGAIFFTGTKNLSLVSNVFENNSANEGGAIKYDKKIPLISTSNLFTNNSAFYGNEIGAYPNRIYIEDIFLKTYHSELIFIKKPSNLYSIFTNITLILKDIYNQTVTTKNHLPLYILLNESHLGQDSVKVFGQTVIFFQNGKAYLNNTFFKMLSNITSFTVLLNTPAIKNLEYLNFTFYDSYEMIVNFNYFINFTIKVSECSVGEIFDKKLMYCIACPIGSYSLSLNSSQCINCPNEAYYCSNNKIFLKKGYWRSNENSTSIYECEPLSFTCLGGYDSQCEIGYRGPLCQSCDSTNISIYSKSSNGECLKCSGKYFYIFVNLMIASFFVILFYIINISSNIKLIDRIKVDITSGEIDEIFKENFYMPIYNKIFINYLQIISLLNKLKLKWSSNILNLLYIQNIFGNASKTLFHFDCLINENSVIPPFYFNMVFVSLTPFISLLVLVIFWVLKSKLSSKKEFNDNKLTTSCLVILTILQPTIVDTMIDAISCQYIDGNKYITANLYYKCEDENYLNYSRAVAYPSLIIWFIYPCFNLIRLYLIKKQLKKIEIRRKLGFLYNSYRLSFYYWEIVENYKKYILILLINFLNYSTETKSLAVLGLIFCSCYLMLKFKPYLTSNVNNFAFFADIVSLFTLFFGLLSFSINESFFIYLGDIITISANIIFLLMFIQRIIMIYHKKLLVWCQKLNIKKLNKFMRFFIEFGTKRLMREKTEHAQKGKRPLFFKRNNMA